MKEIRNFVVVGDKIGTAGQPMPEQFRIIAEAGYKHVINLAMPDHPDSISNEGELVTSLGMSYTHIPVPFDAPKPKHVRQFCRQMESISEDKIFVHCIKNYRVAAFMYHYLSQVKGYNEKDAKSEMFDRWTPNEIWQTVMVWSRSEIGL